MDNLQTKYNLIPKIKDIIKFIFRNIYIIILCPLISMILMYFVAKLGNPTYVATINFMVKEDEGNSFGGIVSLLGNFGFGGGGKTKYNLDKVVALSTSENIVRKSLLDSVKVGSKELLIANLIIDKYKLNDKWKKRDDALSKFSGFHNLDSFSLAENAALKYLYTFVAGSMNNDKLLRSSFDFDNTIISLKVESNYDTLSYTLVNSVFKYLQEFYIYQGTEKARLTVKTLEKKLKNINSKLNKSDYDLAKEKDQSLGTYLLEDEVNSHQISRDLQVNNILYAEIIKNLETARFSLQNATPVFQVIDKPYFPITTNSVSLIKLLFLGFVGGSLIAFLIVYLKFVSFSQINER